MCPKISGLLPTAAARAEKARGKVREKASEASATSLEAATRALASSPGNTRLCLSSEKNRGLEKTGHMANSRMVTVPGRLRFLLGRSLLGVVLFEWRTKLEESG